MLNNFLKSNILFVYLGNFFISGISFFRNILTAKILSVDLYNSWIILNTQMQYVNNFDIGINNGALVRSLESHNSKIRINNILSTSFLSINFQNFFISLILISYFYLFDIQFDLLVILILSFVVNSYSNFMSLLMRLIDKFKENSIFQLISLLISILFILFFWLYEAIAFNIYMVGYSYIFGILLAYIYPSIKYFKREYVNIFSKKILIDILKSGTILTINSFIFLILISMDRFFIDNHYSNISSSIFSFASVFAVSLFMLPNALANVMVNRSIRNYEESNKLIIKNTVIFLGIFFFIITFLMIIFFYFLVNVILIEFNDSISLFSIIISSLSILFFYNITQIISIGEKILLKTTLTNFIFILFKFLFTYYGFKYNFFESINTYCFFSLTYNLIYGISFFVIQNKFSNKIIYDNNLIFSVIYIFFSISLLSLININGNFISLFFFINLFNLIMLTYFYKNKIISNLKTLVLNF